MDPSSLEMVTMLDENSDLWDAFDVQEVGLARGADVDDEDHEIPVFEGDSDDENRAEDIDMEVDIRAADA